MRFEETVKTSKLFNGFSQTYIDMYYISKQKVKEAISRLTLTGYRGNPEGYIDAKLLLKELGLDK